MSPDLLADLNDEQRAAVTHGDGPQLVLAGAGSGKTRVITYRVAWLVRARGVDPGAIVAVTFTNKAAGEMRDRVERLLATWPLPTFVGTFHRYALKLLRRYGDRLELPRDFAILDGEDQRSILTRAMADEGVPEASFPPRSLAAAISTAKNQLIGPERYAAEAHGYYPERVARVFRRYQALCRQAAGIDFDDMLVLAVRLLVEHPEIGDRLRRGVEHLLVDEFQDTNHAQLRLVAELAAPSGNLTAVGDEDQGIYRWRGADLANILDFEGHFPGATVRKLERNYRSTSTILDAANAVVAHNRLRRGKRLWTDAGRGERIALYRAADDQDEARWVAESVGRLRARFALADLAVLVRTNAQTRAFEDEFFRAGIPYSLVGGVRFYERAEIKDLIAYLRVLRNPRDDFSLLRILNQPPRGIGKTTVAQLVERAAAAGGVVWDALELGPLDSFPPRARTALTAFRDLVRDLRRAASELPLPALLDELLARTGYAGLFRREDDEDLGRLENIQEFLSAAQEFTEARAFGGDDEDLLTAFLDHVALVTDLDRWDGERGLSLMTLHSAKGLEFSGVFLPGLEEGLLPHFNAHGRPEDVEEERRLFYVGMTRARERLHLSTARRRRIAGRYQDQLASPLLAEVPEELLEITESPTLYRDERARAIDQYFGRGRAAEAPEPEPAGRRPKRGARVRHPTLGPGVILELEGEGDDTKITIFFDRAGKKKLIARYAALELV